MASRAESEPSAISPWLVATSVMFGTFMEVLDTTVVNVSLPHIAGSLSATTDEATWALTSYLVANAIVLPITGWLARYFGRKRVLMTALAGFTMSSLLCGFAPSLAMLIVFRVVQGLTGGALQPLSQAVMLEAFAPPDRGKAMAFWGIGIVVAPMLGPILGGWLTDNYSWRWVFYVNLPVGITSLVMTRLYVHDPSYLKKTSSRVDVWGLGLLAVGIGALQILLDKGQQEDWFESRLIVFLATLSAAALLAFIIHELKDKNPIVHLRVFQDRTYAVGVTLMTILGFVLFGSLVILPVFLQTLMGYPAVKAGTATAPRGLGSFVCMPFVGLIVARADARKLLGIGMAVAATTLLQLSFLNLNAGYWDIFWPQFFQGMSLALIFVPLTTVTMDPIPREEMGNATSLFNLMRNLGAGFGIATATTLIARDSQRYVNRLGEHVTPFNPQSRALIEGVQRAMRGRGMDSATAAQGSIAATFGIVQRQAGLLAFMSAFRIFGMVFYLVLPLLFILKRPAGRTTPQTESRPEVRPKEPAGPVSH